MKAQEVLSRYAAGERNFRGANLRGRSFRGQDLSGADFREADIRGANFTNAILQGANFTKARAGVQQRWLIMQLAVSFFLSTVLNIASILLNAIFVAYFFSESWAKDYGYSVGILILILIVVIFFAIARQGLTTKAMLTIVIMLSIAIAVTVVGAVASAGTTTATAIAVGGAIAVTGSVASAVTGSVASAVAGSVASTVASSIRRFGAVRGVVAVAATVLVADAVAVRGAGTVAGVGAVAVSCAVGGAGVDGGVFLRICAVAVAGSVEVAVAVLLLSFYVEWRVRKGDEKFALARSFGVAFGTLGGTSFCGADLTEANFTAATLKSSNFNALKQKPTILTHVCWKDVKQLDRARVGDSLLSNAAVRDLLVTRNGYKKSYIRANLRGANLSGVDLQQADLQWADLSEAILQQANLRDANLRETLALGTDFRHAYLTGACLEAWNIDSTTQLDQADCQFVYLLRDQQERRPSSGNFDPGEFTKLFQEVLSTVDLIFRDGIDWKAFTYSFNQLVLDNEGTELSIQSIENKGDGVVVVRVNAPPNADKAKLHSEFNQTYETTIKTLKAKYHAELQAKDEQITIYRQQSADMQEITRLMASRPVTVEVNATSESKAESKAMNDSTDQSRNLTVSGNVTDSTFNLGEINGNVTNSIAQLQTTPEASQLADLLTQLQAAITAEPNLKPDDKTEALEQVTAIAKAGQNPQDSTLKKLASTSIKVIKGTIAALPDTAKIVEACSKLLPAIAHLLGL
jgi:uncharacterized protein YjbI with pentapeptide repeats